MANLQGMMKIISIENIADDVYEMVLEGEGLNILVHLVSLLILKLMIVFSLI